MRADQLDQLDDTARRLREELLANAHLFADPSSYRAGVEDALEGLLDVDGPPTEADDASRPDHDASPADGRGSVIEVPPAGADARVGHAADARDDAAVEVVPAAVER